MEVPFTPLFLGSSAAHHKTGVITFPADIANFGGGSPAEIHRIDNSFVFGVFHQPLWIDGEISHDCANLANVSIKRAIILYSEQTRHHSCAYFLDTGLMKNWIHWGMRYENRF